MVRKKAPKVDFRYDVSIYIITIKKKEPSAFPINHTFGKLYPTVINFDYLCKQTIMIPAMHDGIFIFDETGTILKGIKDKSIESITIPNGVTSIGYCALEKCSCLESVTIPNSVTSIGNGAFYRCSSLKSITIPNSVTSIGNGAFQRCSSLESITIPNSVTSIDNYAFSKCTSLVSIEIPNSVKIINNNTFESCTNLSFVIIPNSVQHIWEDAFKGTAKMTLEVHADILNSRFSEIWLYLERVIVGHEVTAIGDRAFTGHYELTSVTLPDSIKIIGDEAFKGCGRLLEINIPNSVESIGDGAFQGCGRLLEINIPNSVESIGHEAFYDCPLKRVVLPSLTYYSTDSFNESTQIIRASVFISYSKDNEEHKLWVWKLSEDLKKNGIEVILAERLGGEKTYFMEKSITEPYRVLCILTPTYKDMCDSRTNEAGYEASIISSEIFLNIPTTKFIPILRAGDWTNSSPVFLRGRFGVDMTNDRQYEIRLKDIINEIYN